MPGCYPHGAGCNLAWSDGRSGSDRVIWKDPAVADPGAFDSGVAVQPLGDGRYGVSLDRAWWIARGPNGGYVGAVLVRAMEAELNRSERQLRSVTIHYLAPPSEGPAEVVVRVERMGRTLSSLSARLVDGERVLALALAAFASPFEVAEAYEAAAPPGAAEPPPERMPEPRFSDQLPPMVSRFRMLPTHGPPPFSGDRGERIESGGWMELAEGHPLDAALIVLLADAWLPAPFVRLRRPAPAPTLDLTVHVRAPLPQPAGPVFASFRSTLLRDGFFEEDGALYLPGGTLLAQSRQLALLLT